MALDLLDTSKENIGAAIALNVEEDSVLGTQMLPGEDDCNENINVDDQAAVDFSLPPDFNFLNDEE